MKEKQGCYTVYELWEHECWVIGSEELKKQIRKKLQRKVKRGYETPTPAMGSGIKDLDGTSANKCFHGVMGGPCVPDEIMPAAVLK